MPKKSISSNLKKLIVKEKKKFPHLGVRSLSLQLKQKHNINLSKSVIHKILKIKGIKEKKGRKRSILAYKQRGVEYCGLMLLRGLDYQIGLFDYLTNELKKYFPALSKDVLNKLIILKSFSSYINDDFKQSIERVGFLRLASLESLPAKKAKYFTEKIVETTPSVDLEPLKEELKLASTIKLHFSSGYKGYCDAKMSSIWDGLCDKDYFFLPLRGAVNLVKSMLKDKMIIIGYARDLEYLSPSVFNFIKAANSGLNKVQFLDSEGRVLKELKGLATKVSLYLGYCSSVASKGIVFLRRPKKFKRFYWDELGEFFATQILTRLVQPKGKQAVILNNVLIKTSENSKSIWGMVVTGNLSPKKPNLARFLKKYLYLWPCLDRGFSDDLKKGSFYGKKTKDYLCRILPKKIKFKGELDFSRISQVLSVIFKELIYGWEPKRGLGDFIIAKDHLRISLKKLPKELKTTFNKGFYYINGRKAFLTR